jgi:hypothetical protein
MRVEFLGAFINVAILIGGDTSLKVVSSLKSILRGVTSWTFLNVPEFLFNILD